MAASRHRQLLKTGSRAPDFRLARLDGAETSRKDPIANGPALLAFFKISCPVCQLAFPFLDRIHASGALSIYGVCQNGPEDARDFQRRFGISFPLLLDSRGDDYPVSNAYGISTVPTLFLVERDGTVSNVIEGWSKRDVAALGARAGVNPFRQSENVPEWKAG
ncbi:MAG: TlpA family protein disulfide reductase [Acidobacteriia bacterium]|nr:TlpA family protein disulfide reductase [Terriglobia bacterium]